MAEMGPERLVRRVYENEMEGRRGIGRPRKKWIVLRRLRIPSDNIVSFTTWYRLKLTIVAINSSASLLVPQGQNLMRRLACGRSGKRWPLSSNWLLLECLLWTLPLP